ncbi:hypothetical protein Nepgr_028424 [Nepenthes gracilis]|uniref:Uncharacterized protein n=1 Tax=Nepenthes gracilis TaxID=150966 RepID=A0AAD3Y4I5_NEPGR|nr:hypothetical protein Nepgr_028424 [Nepenthes gracilis]
MLSTSTNGQHSRVAHPAHTGKHHGVNEAAPGVDDRQRRRHAKNRLIAVRVLGLHPGDLGSKLGNGTSTAHSALEPAHGSNRESPVDAIDGE